MRPFVAAVLPFALAGCVETRIPVASPGLVLDPVNFFTGRSEGDGTLHTIIGGADPVNVQSLGRPDGKAGLVLVQLIRQGDKRPRRRIWTLRPVGQGRYTGELTDARGPVHVEVRGGSAQITYSMQNGMDVWQLLALRDGGRVIANSLHLSRFGIQVARLDETIRKLD